MLGYELPPIASPLHVGGMWGMSVCDVPSANPQWHVLGSPGSLGSLADQGLPSPLAPSSSCSAVYILESLSAAVSSRSPAIRH